MKTTKLSKKVTITQLLCGNVSVWFCDFSVNVKNLVKNSFFSYTIEYIENLFLNHIYSKKAYLFVFLCGKKPHKQLESISYVYLKYIFIGGFSANVKQY